MGKRIQRFTLPVGSEEETSPDSSTVGPLEKGAHDFSAAREAYVAMINVWCLQKVAAAFTEMVAIRTKAQNNFRDYWQGLGVPTEAIVTGAASAYLLLRPSNFYGTLTMASSEKSEKQTAANTTLGAGIAIGTGVGASIGTAIGNVGAGIGVGIALGVAIGLALQRKNAAT